MVYQNEDELREAVRALHVGESVELDTLSFSSPRAARGYIKKKGRSDYVLMDRSNRERSRWGNLEEIVQDGMFFIWNGKLPPPSGARW